MNQPWKETMPEEKFDFMRQILAAPSPVNLEAAMSHGVLKPFFEGIMPDDWKIHYSKGNAGIVLDTDPNNQEKTSVMIVGHADKIRLQVRSISSDGKIWVNSDSFLPTTLIGHEVTLFCHDPEKPNAYRCIEGGTIEALGAIHFSSPAARVGKEGVKKEMLYLELQMVGDKNKETVEKLGIRPGDPIILNRPIKRGFTQDTFYGAYLDNGLGCFAVAELARLFSEAKAKNIRLLFAIATHEEIGRRGSTTLVGTHKPDVLISVDVSHDYNAAPGISSKKMHSIAMGSGFSITNGVITSEFLNNLMESACKEKEIPYQVDFGGRDTGTDAMAAVLSGTDCVTASLGFPIRNMHTISETGHTNDVLAGIYGIEATLRKLDSYNNGNGIKRSDFEQNHPNLSLAKKNT